jgi:hypothetical protein
MHYGKGKRQERSTMPESYMVSLGYTKMNEPQPSPAHFVNDAGQWELDLNHMKDNSKIRVDSIVSKVRNSISAHPMQENHYAEKYNESISYLQNPKNDFALYPTILMEARARKMDVMKLAQVIKKKYEDNKTLYATVERMRVETKALISKAKDESDVNSVVDIFQRRITDLLK